MLGCAGLDDDKCHRPRKRSTERFPIGLRGHAWKSPNPAIASITVSVARFIPELMSGVSVDPANRDDMLSSGRQHLKPTDSPPVVSITGMESAASSGSLMFRSSRQGISRFLFGFQEHFTCGSYAYWYEFTPACRDGPVPMAAWASGLARSPAGGHDYAQRSAGPARPIVP